MRPATEALIVIDVQNDFCPGGALAVADGNAIIPRINAVMDEFAVKVLTQDWHPANHASFAANHPGAVPLSQTRLPYGPLVLWPTTPTGLEGYLRARGVSRLTLAGLATDFCVAYSALDAARLGFDVVLLEGACRAIDLNGSLEDAKATMLDAGIVMEP